ncbi:RDD family protein [Suttonella ornithocola]|uniref:RDD family n=1 Tax=Suttonella ornithocola TaxID=279832 RepID=A0A380MYC1_9GAMM|nr:RDD family protein [Suttonella ornithocola]SUO96447.1 RDD family [Suttonella ornithocola]
MVSAEVSVYTPEGISIKATLANPFQRLWALFIDIIIITLMLGLLAWLQIKFFLFSLLGLALALAFILIWGYFFCFEAFCNGMTPGKWLLKIQAVNADLTPLSIRSAMWRNVLRYIDFLPGCFGVGAICILFFPQTRRLGDLMADTLVIIRQKNPPSPKPLIYDAQTTPPPWKIDYQGQLALSEFARFAPHTSLERLAEMTEPFAPLLPKLSQEERVKRLIEIAAWFEQGGIR